MRKLILAGAATTFAFATMPLAPDAQAWPRTLPPKPVSQKPVSRRTQGTAVVTSVESTASNHAPAEEEAQPDDALEPKRPNGRPPTSELPKSGDPSGPAIRIRRPPPNGEIEFAFDAKFCPTRWQQQGALTRLDQFHLDLVDAASGVSRTDVVIEGDIPSNQFIVEDPKVFDSLRAYANRLVRARFTCSLNGQRYDLPHRYKVVLSPITGDETGSARAELRSGDTTIPTLPDFVTSSSDRALAYRLIVIARFGDVSSISMAPGASPPNP